MNFSKEQTRAILASVKTVAMIGASANPSKPSNDVLQFMLDRGYDMIPVNPHAAGSEILGLPVVAWLAELGRPVDMVQVFRPRAELYSIAEQAIAIKAKVLWSQLNIIDHAAADLATQAGLTVVMDRCPKIEFQD